MVKAYELIKEQQKREQIKIETFKKIYQNVEKKIILASASNYYYVWFEVPEFIFGYPAYKMNESIEYIKDKLIDNQFEIETYLPNILLIKWFPK